nr:MAG TPA: hypothetical protein [Caudoviricetes sp.]
MQYQRFISVAISPPQRRRKLKKPKSLLLIRLQP